MSEMGIIVDPQQVLSHVDWSASSSILAATSYTSHDGVSANSRTVIPLPLR